MLFVCNDCGSPLGLPSGCPNFIVSAPSDHPDGAASSVCTSVCDPAKSGGKPTLVRRSAAAPPLDHTSTWLQGRDPIALSLIGQSHGRAVDDSGRRTIDALHPIPSMTNECNTSWRRSFSGAPCTCTCRTAILLAKPVALSPICSEECMLRHRTERNCIALLV